MNSTAINEPGAGPRVPGRWVVRLTLVLVAGLALALLLIATSRPSRPSTALEVVLAWEAARNAHDVDAAMALIADDATIFGVSLQTPEGRAWHRSVLAAQSVAEHSVRDSDCAETGELVTCRYVQDDAFLRLCGLTLSGEHRFLARDGRLTTAIRRHDPDSSDAAYAAVEAFRSWVASQDPAAEAVIWSDPGSVFYTTPEGATTMRGFLDGYVCGPLET